MRPPLLALLIAVLFPASAPAAPFGETRPVAVSMDCMLPTGAPGEVATVSGRRVRFVAATRQGLTVGDGLRFPSLLAACPVAASAPNGAGVLAGTDGDAIYAALRAPGEDWSDLQWNDDRQVSPDQMVAAVSPDGDAIVAWVAYRVTARDAQPVISVMRRLAGGFFGTPENIANVRPRHLQVGVADTGEAFVLWDSPERPRAPRHNTIEVNVTTAARGTSFAAPVRLAEIPRHSVASLAVATDGHALVALPGRRVLNVAERAPGGAFGIPSPVASLRDPVGTRTAAVLGAAGRGAIAWSGIGLGGVSATTLPGVAAALAAPDPRLRYDLFYAAGGATLALPLGSWGFDGAADLGVALAGDRALVTWTGPAVDRGLEHSAANAAMLPLGGGAVERHTIGGELFDAVSARPLLLAGGTPAVTWTDTGSRLRLAAEGVTPGAEAAIPRVRIGRPERRVLAPAEPLRLPVRCSGPCEVRGQVLGAWGATGTLRLPRGGTGRLRIAAFVEAIAPAHPSPVRVRFTYGTSDARTTRSRTRTFRLAVRRGDPGPRLHSLRAVRRGSAIRVTWRTGRPLPGDSPFFATGASSRASTAEPIVESDGLAGDRVVLSTTLRPASGVRWVTLRVPGARPAKLTVRVR